MISKFHSSQAQVASDRHRYRLVNCGRQWGKTTLAIEEMKACAYSKAGREVAYFATTFDQARNIAWTMLKDSTRGGWSRTPNESRLELYIGTQEGGESRITLRGYESIETARGQQFDLLVIDEVAQMKNFQYAWQAILEPTLAFRSGTALFISTPLGFNHFYEMFTLGQQDNPLWKSWKFTSYDNPFLPKANIDNARLTSTDDYFMQEYMADFRHYTGLVYKEFKRDLHVKELPDFQPRFFIRGLDRGYTAPTAVPIIAVNREDVFYQIDELYEPGLTNPAIQERLKTLSQTHQIKEYELSTMDSVQIGDIIELNQLGADFSPVKKESGEANQNYVTYKVQKMAERLKNNKYFVHPKCTNTVFEFEHYEWQQTNVPGASALLKEQPLKVNDHMMDALGDLNATYIHTYETPKKPWESKIPGTFVPISMPDEDEPSGWAEQPKETEWDYE